MQYNKRCNNILLSSYTRSNTTWLLINNTSSQLTLTSHNKHSHTQIHNYANRIHTVTYVFVSSSAMICYVIIVYHCEYKLYIYIYIYIYMYYQGEIVHLLSCRLNGSCTSKDLSFVNMC